MKKLSLKNLKLEASSMLQRDELKTVLGGGYGPCPEGSFPCVCDGLPDGYVCAFTVPDCLAQCGL
ncbi:hypothetical protein BFR04_06810 [Gaetbulibacter sp. 4G1]|nr:hypothetical protein [Gaetbulibacter sp. 4G1]PIA79223.1 hypothetical protein BFR04_06810 [Gaetbulibacter sp. 4G1]